ncbi:gramicidin S synthetase 1 [Apiospora marii]|uniref:Gramicidin S synthetase 1 n=1 Tax=Apiospora marii TaxID=335849 RepID=A0ABR1RVW5_9PEZI
MPITELSHRETSKLAASKPRNANGVVRSKRRANQRPAVAADLDIVRLSYAPRRILLTSADADKQQGNQDHAPVSHDSAAVVMLLRGAEGLSFNNPNPRQLAGPRFLHELLPHQGISGGEPALDYSDKDGRQSTLSYGELHRRSGRLAARIAHDLQHGSEQSRGSGGTPLVVPVMIPQSPELYLSILAILKCGGAFCPLNLDAPSERVGFILGDVKASIVLTTRALAPSIQPRDGVACKVLCVDELDLDAPSSVETNGVTAAATSSQIRAPDERDLAYVMYTSGSTGTPKGVGVSHLAATQSLLAHDRHIPAFSRFLQFAAPTFDVSVFEIFFPLFRGATLVACDRARLLTNLPGVIRQLKVDACELTPSVAGSLLKARRNAPNLRLLLTIGEMLTQPVIDEFGGDEETPGILWGMYGPTEAAIHCTLQPAFRRDYSTRCIGFPLDTVSSFVIRIADETDSQIFDVLPIGEVGELAVGGHQLASEYLNRPEQTAQAFIETKYGRVYKTGDKALMRPDGSIECLGRVSEGQVKLNGQRMELGEIEHAILRTAGCHSSYVCVLDNLLVAFVAGDAEYGDDDSSNIEERVKAVCKTWLPAFMVPAEIVTMDSFPQLPSGKIDRQRLRQDYAQGKYTTPDNNSVGQPDKHQNDVQKRLCETVSQVLQAPVSLSTNLMAAGLDSLVSIALAARLRDNGHAVNTLDVMRARTALDLYNLVPLHQPDADLSVLVNGNLKDVEGYFRCTELQKSMVAETLRDPRLYINTMDIALPPGHSSDTVKSWILHVAACNDILRTGFMHSGDELIQIVWNGLKESQVQIVQDFTPLPSLGDTEQFLERPFRVEIISTTSNSSLSHKEATKARLFVHHALYDGWSFDLLLDDLTALAQGKHPAQRPQFHDIAQQLRSLLDDDQNGSLIAVHEFWAEHLRGAANNSLPNFRTTAIDKPEISSVCGEIASVAPAKVRQVCLETGSSSQAIFQSCLVWFWSALTGSDDVTIGSVFSGRTLPVAGIEKVMGPCIQTLPVRTKLGQCRTIRDLVRNLHNTNRQILQLAPLSLAGIRKTAGLPQGCRLFDVLFVYQDTLSNRARDDGSVESFAQNLGHLVNYVVGHIEEPISSIAPSFPREMLSTYTPSRTKTAPSTSSNIVAMVERTAAANHGHDALCFAEAISASNITTSLMTYQELNETANQVARHLRAQKVEAGGIVAIIMEKSPWLYCGILGILKAGCAYLPILPSTPIRRIQLIFQQAQPQHCIVDKELLSSLWNDQKLRECCPLAAFDVETLKQYNTSNLTLAIPPSQLAYVIYTSGTTGVPKGVAVTHGNLQSNIDVLSRLYPPHDDKTSSRMLQVCSQAFDVSVFEIFFSWANGMCLCAGTNDTLFEDLELSIRRLGVTHLSMTVTVASLVDPDKVPRVSFLVTSGEPMTDEVAAKWAPKLYQGYGPSETTNICTVRQMSAGDSSQYLGWSFENTPTFVLGLDDDANSNAMAPVPIGYVGEFCFGGDQVAAGYLNMPDLTASRFVEHPDYGRLYRSGDLGRMLPDGSLIILGRVDTQIKLRGQRIELQDVHAQILGSGLARACASIVFQRENDKSQHLTSFYVPLHQEEGSQGFAVLDMDGDDVLRTTNLSISQALQASLPSYMLPTFLVPIARTPLTSSGKINTGALRDSIQSLSDDALQKYVLGSSGGDDQEDTAVAEWTDMERTIASALAETLGIGLGQVSRWTSFLVLGLDSLTAMAFTRRLNKRLQSRVTISEVLKHTSVARLSNFLSQREQTSSSATPEKKGTEAPSLLPGDLCAHVETRLRGLAAESILPCTPLQEAMLASSASSSDGTAYRNQLLFRLRRAPDEIRRYWDEMCARHGILRTCFLTTDSTDYPFLQVVLSPRPTGSASLPWSRLETADVAQAAREHMRDAFGQPVNSFKPPLGLALIHDTSAAVADGDGETYLSFVCHHALYDGMAMKQLLSEIEALAQGQVLPEPPIPFGDFLQEALSLPPGTDEFWKSQFNSFVPQKLPSQLAAGMQLPDSVGSGSATVSLNAMETRAHEIYGAPLSSLCQAAWAATLATVLGCSDVCFGNVVSGRSVALEGVDRLVAPCFNTVPLRIDMSQGVSGGSTMELIRRCRDANVGVMPFQFTPLRRVQAALATDRRGDRGQLFDTMLLLQPPTRALDETVWSLEEERGDMDVPLICEFITATDNDTLRVVIHHQANHVSDSVACLLREIVLRALQSFMESPSSGLDLLAPMPSPLRSVVEGIRAAAQSEKRAVDDAATTDMAATSLNDEEEPLTEVELTVRNVVAKLAKIEGVAVTTKTSLHRLGIDSIGMVQLVYLLRQEGLEISPVDVFENPTCAGIVQRCLKIDSNGGGDKNQQSPPAQTYDLTGFQRRVRDQVSSSLKGHDGRGHMLLPCTPVQQGMVSQSIHSQGGTYINSVSWDLDLSVDMEALERAWGAMAERHDILRTGFLPISDPDASFAMVVRPKEGNVPPIEVHAADFDTTSWRERCREEIMRDLLVPPWRLALVHKEEEAEGGRSKQMHLVMHHALYDASSLRVLLRDLTNMMLAVSQNQQQTNIMTPSLETAVKAVFADMAHEKPEAEKFWRGQADGAVVNPFPIMTPLRVENGTTERSCRRSRIPLPTLKQQAAKAEVTFQAALQAAWARTLSAYLGESSVTFGVVLDSRSAITDNKGEGEEALLPRITTLPVIANSVVDPNREMLGSMMAFNANLRRCLNVPLPQVQKWLGHAGSPLFDTILVYQAKEQGLDNASGPWRVRDETAAVDYPISLEIEEEETDTAAGSSSSLSLNLVYRTDILPAPQAKLLLDQFDAVLSHLLEHPDGSADELAATAPEVFSILPAQHPELPSGGVRLLHEFVTKSAESLPEKTALEYVEELGDEGSQQRWTYRELDAAGNQVAHMLVQRGGVKPGDIVAVCFDKCPEAYLSILGILKAGAAFVALDASAPASRLGFILSDSGAVALLHRGGLPESGGDLAAQLSSSSGVPSIAIALDQLAEYPSLPPQLSRPATPEDTCYCLYTSGTTGTPKGCLISHESTVQAMLAFQALFAGHWDADSRWLQFASLHFDVSILEQYWTWSVGVALVAAPRDAVLSDLPRAIAELAITHIDLTPSLARLVHPDEAPSLCRGVFITGGEQLRQDILDVWGERGVIYNAYGPTEATIGVTMYPRVPRTGRSSNIGRQFLNVGSFVFRPGTEVPVLRGAVGELCVSGRLVGKGYLNRPELTAERFPVLSSSSSWGGERVYRTGDLVRVLHDGCFDFLGRADDQVKLRGQRLEIGEINHTIRAGVSGVSDVATLVTRHGQQDRDVLVSFVVSNTAQKHETSEKLTVRTDSESTKVCAEARDACRAKLPGYMVPTYFLCVPTIPLSANNKAQIGVLKQLFNDISLDQLRQLSSSAAAGGETADSLVQSTEPQLAQVLARLTGVAADQIRSSNTIYDLGFDSISVISLARELHAASYPGATPSMILQNPHLGTLIKRLKSGSAITTPVVSSQVVRVKQAIAACNHKNFGAVMDMLNVAGGDIEYIAPCTPLQEGMLSRSSSGAYFNSFQFAVDGQAISIPRLKGAWEAVVADHAILRTCFLQTPTDGYSYVQVALRKDAAPLRWTEIVGTKGDESRDQGWASRIQEDRFRQWISTNANNNDATGVRYPLEVDCILQDNAACTLVVRIFHGIYDARSFDLILERVQAAYDNATENTAATAQGPSFIDVLPHGPLCDYSDTRSFWQGIFQDSSESGFQAFPCLISPGSENDDDATQSRCLDLRGLEERRLELGVTQQTIVQAAWLYVLKQQYPPSRRQQQWPTVGVVLSGRSLMLEGIENTIGPLFNTLPFRVGKQDNDSALSDWPSLVLETHLFNTSVLPFVHTPLRQVQKWCAQGQPLFDTLFTFDRESAGGSVPEVGQEEGEEAGLWTQVESSTKADYALAFEAIATADQKLKITLVAQGHVVDSTALRRLLDQFEEAVNSLSSNDRFPANLGTSSDLIDDESRQASSPSPQVASPQQTPSDFIWSDDACALRDEIAALANLPPEEVGEDANLLQLGLDSIDAIKLVSRLRKRVGLPLTTNELMRQASLRDIIERHRSSTTNSTTATQESSNGTNPPAHQVALGARISQLQTYLTEHALLDSPSDDVESVLPTTPLQDAMVAEMVVSDFHRYFNHDVLELLPGTDMQALESALRLVVSRSPILRTAFVEITDPAIPTAYCQVVAKRFDPFHEAVTLETEDDFQRVFETARSRASQAKGRSGLLQFTPASLSPSGRQFVVLSIAHALYDGASLDMFHQDVQAAYRKGGGSNRERPPYQPVLGDILNSTTREARNFWAGFLHDANSTMVPETQKNIASADEESPTVHRAETLSTLESAKLKSFCRHQRITMQTLGQACWAVVLSTLAQSLDVTFGVVMSGRDTADAQELMFPTMNTVPVRAVLHGTVGEYLRYAWGSLSRIHQFQHFPLRSAQKLVGKGPLFNTLFTMQQSRDTAEQTVQEEDDDKSAIWKSVHSASEVEYPICVEMELTDSGLMWRTACSTDYVPSSEDGEQLLRQLDEVLAYFVDTNNLDKEVVATDPTTHQISVCGLPPFQIIDEGADGEATVSQPFSSFSNAINTTRNVLEAQETLIQVLAEASGLDPSTIRPEHSIYHLGLDSISLIKVSSVLRKRGMRGANARDLLKKTSVAEMAAKIAAAAHPRDDPATTKSSTANATNGNVSSSTAATTIDQENVLNGIDVDAAMALTGLGKDNVETVLPALPVQVHFLSQWQNTDGGLFFWSFKLRLPTTTNTSNIQQAWARLVKELPILRTHFAATGSSEIPFLQFVARPTTPAGEEAITPSRYPVTYQSSPFAQLSVAKRDGTTGLELTLKLHHALYDGISLPLIMRRLENLCADSNEVPPTNKLDSKPWHDFVKSHYVDSVRTERKPFWSKYLKGVVKAQPNRSSSTTTNGAAPASSPSNRTSVFRPAALAEVFRLKKAASRDGVSPQALFLAAYAQVLAETAAPTEANKTDTANSNGASDHDVVFGIYLANRASFSNNLETAPCPTLSIVPLRVRFTPGEPTASMAARIQADLAEVSRSENASVGLWEIEQWTGGLRLDSFVNFLSLPKDDDDNNRAEDDSTETMSSPPIDDRDGEEEEVTSTPPINSTEEEWLATPSSLYMTKNAVRQTYMDAIDVEAAINAESLDLGVFASPERMSEPEAGGLIDRLVAVLRSV